MTGVEAVLLLIGVVFLVGSFFVTEKLSPADVNKVAELSEDELCMIVDRELEVAKAKVSDMVDDAMDLTVDQVQRTMERGTNEKIMAISEYSDSVMEKLEKMNHEVTFLYSMLGDKHTQLNETINELHALIGDYQLLREQLAAEQRTVMPVAEEPAAALVQTEVVQGEEAVEEVPPAEEEPTAQPEPESVSVREQILERYHAGEDLTDIARNLGLGFGEVKLIIELYRGEEEQ